MRNVPYSERIRNFVEKNIQIQSIQNGGVSTILDYRPMMDRLNGSRLPEELQDIQLSDLTDIWANTSRGYLQNIGLEGIDFQNGFLDGIRMYHVSTPIFVTSAPVSYRTQEEIATGNHSQYTFSLDHKAFESKQHLVDYLISNLVQGREIFLYSVGKSMTVYDPTSFLPIRRYDVRLKVVDWGERLGRTDFSFLKVKNNFTPPKNIPKFTM